MVSPSTHGASYPSPKQTQVLPFYQQVDQQDPSAQQYQEIAGDDRTASGSSAMADDLVREVPDDPQLRANLASMMGNFGNFGALSNHMNEHAGAVNPSVTAESPVAYAQVTDVVHESPQSPDKARDKRTKVSRACDDCRRKKIRCDAVDESGSIACSNCVRTGVRCAFSRQPLKRGPSKGYIRDLADRLNSLEQQVHPSSLQRENRNDPQQIQQLPLAVVDDLHGYLSDGRLPHEPQAGDKRSHDVAEALHAFQSHNNMGTHPLAAQNINLSLQAQPSNQPFWRSGSNDGRFDTVGMAFDAEPPIPVASFDWNESVIDEYYRLIHQTFPLLPNSKNRLRQRLGICPASLREAFLVALDCLMRTFPTTTLPPNAGYPQVLKRAAELLAKYPFDNPSSHTNASNLLYLQTLLLMALESDNHGPATIRGQAGPSRAEWLGRAAGVAGQLEINAMKSTSHSVMEGDRDSEERLARRVWWVLFILDRWHASSTADLLKLPENSVVLLPEDQILLGESTYHLARLSFIIGHLAAILTTTKTPSTDVMAPSNPASSLLGLTLAGEIDRFRESVESVWGSLNLVHLSYHHCHLLIKRLNPTTEPSELVGHAVKVATVLNSRLTPVTPLNHHFGALAAMTLCELCDVAETRAEAMRGLDQMIECLGEGRGLAGRLESEGWDGAVRELVKSKKERMMQHSGGLQHLADAAVGGQRANFEPTMLTRYGYLTSLGQGVFARHNLQ
ncbi:uncharacterized protein K489DRAFT_379583 [Dissoconium aciculare CBS 342.82]|uniref:Zn(2)-C6 fungal-type domain-containing protein n=1 Tax=Dissoconium aciculare CBS 342.82 TaxID=1314786 RepID=A0A6J3M9U8_9PEZI|nr:uncharacterized protein K489DRAFT_379583 [Dissoconium aciculare CBS 342.82]KAF1823587.1 hypothetical protein K489DRAFT_379583 [Dissoconium aciculare CBS 342.82]